MMRIYKNILLFSVIFMALACKSEKDISSIHLSFDENKEFKILQLTDVHWCDIESENNEKNIQLFDFLINAENPNLIVFTGDVVVDPPIKEGWKSIAKIMGKYRIPWTAVMGNHDTEEERGFSRNDIHSYINEFPFYLSSKELENYDLSSFVLPLTNYSSNEVSHLIYCIDTHDYADNQDLSHYDWVNLDQMNWYKKISDKYKYSSVHALAFFHIPLVEYNTAIKSSTLYGSTNEQPSTPDLNSGLFTLMASQGDVHGVFVGHDHNNDFIDIYKDIALGYGRVSGYGAYGKLNRGARVIKLYQGQKRFDTWLIDPSEGTTNLYYYPSGISKEEEDTLEYLPATNLLTEELEQGVDYKYYEARYKTVKSISQKDFVLEGIDSNFNIDIAQRKDSFALAFDSYIFIKDKGVYDFYTKSDDGSQLYIGDQLVVDNDGSHSARLRFGRVALNEGFYPIKVLYFEDYMGEELIVSYSNKFIEKTKIPDALLHRKKK